jgi:UDP-2,3-diacylglucosamine hydrolase
MSKIYFASDFHLGVPNHKSSLEREKKIVRWLNHVGKDATEIILLGDVFDFWFEYKHVVPKGYTRLLGTLAHLADSGIKITLFKGNHDMWMFGYLKEEIGVEIIDNEKIVTWGGKRFFLHHGDGLGPGDRGYKLIKNIFRNKWCQRLFAFIHPFLGMGLAQYLSTKSRLANDINKQPFDEPNEWLLQYCKEKIETEHFDYLIFGHRHLPLDIQLNENSRYVNLGEWVNNFTYAEFDGEHLTLKKFE